MSEEKEMQNSEQEQSLKNDELTPKDLSEVTGGSKQKPDGTAAGNVAAKWSVAQGSAA